VAEPTGSGLWRRLSTNVSPTRRAALRRLVKYASVSAISTVTSLTVLALLTGALGLNAVLANIVAVGVGTVPSFELNRRWVWSQPRHGARATQVVPFCLLSFSGLVISSGAVQLAAETTAGDGRLWHTIAVEVANVGSYGALWLVQYFLCAQLLFKPGGSQVALGTASQGVQGGAVESLVTGRTAIGAINEAEA
jgi:putative flippase GtrA